MKRIWVCFTTVNDTDAVLRRDWQAAALGSLDISYSVEKLNSYDEAALEHALALKDQYKADDTPAEVCAITVAGQLKQGVYRNLFAAGVDRVVLLRQEEAVSFRPQLVAGALAAFIGQSSWDCVFTGQQNSIGCNGITGALLARHLGAHWVSHVSEVLPTAAGLRVEARMAQAQLCATVKEPAIYSFHNARRPYLRVATLREKMAVSGREPEILDIGTDAGNAQDILPGELFFDPIERACRMIDGGTAGEKVAELVKQLGWEAGRG